MTTPYSSANSPFLPDPVVYPPRIRIPILRRGRPIFSGTYDNTPSSVALATITTQLPLQATDIQESLFLSGACPSLYDGTRVHEAGFNYYPEASYLSEGAGGSLTAAGVYSFLFVYEWLDAKGKLHRSGTSVPVAHTMGGAATRATFKIAPMWLTNKQDRDVGGTFDNRNGIQLACYRTAAGGTIYYRDQPTLLQYNQNRLSDGTAGRSDVYLSSGITDAALVSGEILYTTGGALDNQAFPSSTICCTHQRRLFTVTQEDQSFVRFTDETDDSFLAIGTNEVYSVAVPDDGGSVVALASMDDKLIILCQHRIYYMFGEGPNRLGQQSSYSQPQLCSASLGAKGGSHESLALTPEGLWFMSSSGGLRMLTRGLQIALEDSQPTHLGREADGLVPAGFTYVRAIHADSRSQVRWYFSGSVVLVWDYQQRQWSRFTNHNTTGGVVSARGTFWHSDATNVFSANAAAGGLDDTTNVVQVVETAWIAVAGIQGFQRIYKLMLLAQAIGPCQVDVAVGFDYDETWITSAGGVNFRYSVTTAANPLQIEHPMHIQQCESVRFRITITPVALLGVLYNGKNVVWSAGNGGTILPPGNNVNGIVSGAGTIFGNTLSTAATGNLGISFITSAFVAGQLITDNDLWEADVNGTPSTVILVSTLPTVGATITGATSGATATVASFITYTTTGGYGIVPSGQVGTFTDGETLSTNVGTVEGLRLTGMSLAVGVKSGLNRLAATKRF